MHGGVDPADERNRVRALVRRLRRDALERARVKGDRQIRAVDAQSAEALDVVREGGDEQVEAAQALGRRRLAGDLAGDEVPAAQMVELAAPEPPEVLQVDDV